MTKKKVVRLNISGFPEELKDEIAQWGESVVPKVGISELFIKLAQDWRDDIVGFERKYGIRRIGDPTVNDDAVRRKAAKIAELKRQLAEEEGR